MRAERRRSLCEKARYLMRPNFSRDGYGLYRAAEVLKIDADELDLVLWHTNGGQTPEEHYFAAKREEPVEEAPRRQDERGHHTSYDPKRADKVLRRFG